MAPITFLLHSPGQDSQLLGLMHLINKFTVITEKAMATRSSTLAWKIPWMEELGRLQSMGSLKVGHD